MSSSSYNKDTLVQQTTTQHLEMRAWPEIDFVDDCDGCLFTATVHRKVGESSPKKSEILEELSITSGKTSGKILDALELDGELTIPELASMIGVTERSVERNIKKLQEQGRLRQGRPGKRRLLGSFMSYKEAKDLYSILQYRLERT